MKIDNDDKLKIDASILKRFESFTIIKISIIKILNLND